MLHKRLISVLIILAAAALAAPGALLAQTGSTPPAPPGRLAVGDENGLFTLLADGSQRSDMVGENEEKCWLRDGAWSPDGERLLYTRICGGSSPTDWHAPERTAKVQVYDLAAQTDTELVANDGTYQDYAGDWSPDGRQVVIYSNRSADRYNFYLVTLATGEATTLTTFDDDVGRVTWDPSGRYLLYNRYVILDDQLRWEIHAWDTSTSENQNDVLVAIGLTPHWSPDGQWIAYATEGEVADVFVMPADCIRNGTPCDPDTQAHNITYTPEIGEREPLWSPDQTQITYLRDTSQEPGTTTWDIFRQDLRTGLLQNLTNTPGISERQSDWEPVAGQTPVDVEGVLPVVVQVESATANLRELPTTNSGVFGAVRSGQILFVQGANQARDWFQITLPADGTTAWIRGDLVEVVTGDLDAVPEIPAAE